MKRFFVVLSIALASLNCGSNEDTEPIDTCPVVSVPGEMAIIRFPLTVNVDGVLDDAAWSNPSVEWSHVGSSHALRSEDPNYVAATDADISYDFAIVADSNFIYIAAKVKDDHLIADSGTFNYFDDALEVYIDVTNNKNTTPQDGCTTDAPCMDANEYQVLEDILGHMASVTDAQSFLTAPAVPTDDGYTIEFGISLTRPDYAPIVLEEGGGIALEVDVMDDDGGRDYWGCDGSWCLSSSPDDQAVWSQAIYDAAIASGLNGAWIAYQTPNLWGSATFCQLPLAR